MLVKGVLVPVPLPVGVELPVAVPPSLSLAFCFATFSANRFCLEAEGAIVIVDRRWSWGYLCRILPL
jgi:hypothetical protein